MPAYQNCQLTQLRRHPERGHANVDRADVRAVERDDPVRESCCGHGDGNRRAGTRTHLTLSP
jgi:hypothetical protein